MKSYKSRKTPFLLIEVMIALFIVTLALLPLLAPQAQILKEEKRHLKELQLAARAHTLYALDLASIYQRTLSLEQLGQKEVMELPKEALKGLPYRGFRRFSLIDQTTEDSSCLLLDITYEFTPTSTFEEQTSKKFTYKIFLKKRA